MTSPDRLTELFGKFPGIGPRQARRFVFFLLSSPPGFRSDLAKAIQEIASSVSQCRECGRFFSGTDSSCQICASKTRDRNMLMIVERDVDLENIEKAGTYKGLYLVLGGLIPLLSENPPSYVRLSLLKRRLKELAPELEEIILAFSATSDGDTTARYIRDSIKKDVPEQVRITTLGRGLSTGSELEYADADTIGNAFKNRKD